MAASMSWLFSMQTRRTGGVLLDLEQFHLEDQGRVRRDHTRIALGAVGQLGWDGELALAADVHCTHTLVPPLDDLSLAEGELKRLLAHRGVKYLAVSKPAGVINHHRIALLGHRALA